MTAKNVNSHCIALAKSGKPCRAAATAGGLCYFHANPNKASELGRIGGRNKGRSAAANADPVAKLDNAIAVQDALAQLIADLQAGKTQPRVATALTQAISLQLRVIETTNLEGRVTRLEKLSDTPPPSEASEILKTLDEGRLRVARGRDNELREQSRALANISNSSRQPGDPDPGPGTRAQAARSSM